MLIRRAGLIRQFFTGTPHTIQLDVTPAEAAAIHGCIAQMRIMLPPPSADDDLQVTTIRSLDREFAAFERDMLLGKNYAKHT